MQPDIDNNYILQLINIFEYSFDNNKYIFEWGRLIHLAVSNIVRLHMHLH